MVIKNLTSKLQYLWIQNLLGGRSVSVQVLPNGRRELAHTYIPDRSMMPDFDKIFEIEGTKKPTIEESITIETHDVVLEEKIQEETQEEPHAEVSEEVETTPETNESKFICPECGAEFGSARGLASHMSRAHAQS